MRLAPLSVKVVVNQLPGMNSRLAAKMQGKKVGWGLELGGKRSSSQTMAW
jgi:hypothetical protein